MDWESVDCYLSMSKSKYYIEIICDIQCVIQSHKQKPQPPCSSQAPGDVSTPVLPCIIP